MASLRGIKGNLISYLALMLLCLAGILYGQSLEGQHQFLRVWDIATLAWMGVGIPFLFLQNSAGIPDFWETGITHRKRLLYPLLIGMVFGALDVFVFKILLHPEPYTELPPFLQPFPYSLMLYLAGAFEVEVFYRLIPLTIFLLLGKKLAQARYYSHFLWTAVILTSLREPVEQLPSGDWTIIVYSLCTGFLMNFIQAIVFTRYGFISSLTLRLGHYLLWHILLGAFVEYVELG